jgi:hypothetical protein
MRASSFNMRNSQTRLLAPRQEASLVFNLVESVKPSKVSRGLFLRSDDTHLFASLRSAAHVADSLARLRCARLVQTKKSQTPGVTLQTFRRSAAGAWLPCILTPRCTRGSARGTTISARMI